MQEQETVVINEAKATLKYARISARKVKIVADLIRGKNVDEALAIVKFTPKASSEIIENILKKYFKKVIIRSKKHNYKITGTKNKNSSKELIFICKN